MSMHDTLNALARRLYNFVASPLALMLAFASICVWLALGPHYRFGADWLLIVNTVGTIVTFLMVFVLNNAQSRDTAAVNAKLDALILAIEGADNRFVGVEEKNIEETRPAREHIANAVADAQTLDAQTLDEVCQAVR
jgi:low affinity Fe/Cu permease